MSAQERFDLINEKDEVIGATDKETAHATGQLHRVVAVFVFDDEENLYIQKHKLDGKFDHSVGGHVSQGESYDDAAKREAIEELGITSQLARISILYADETARGRNMRHMFGLYETHSQPGWEFVANDEVDAVFPMKIDQIVHAMNDTPEKFTLGFLCTMREYIKQKKLPYALK